MGAFKKSVQTGGSLILFAMAISSCAPIQLVSNYDATIDSEAQQLQKKIDSYFVSLENATDNKLEYKEQQTFYEGVLTDINAMEVRAGGIYKNKITIEQIGLVKINLAYLVLLHKGCVLAPLTSEQIKRVTDNGVDLSMDCHINNGASTDITDRGKVRINRLMAPQIQSMFNQELGAIMAFELAKKRGDAQPK